MKIYNSSGTEILDIIVDDNSYRNRAVMGDHNLTLYFSLPTHTEIPVGAYVDYQNIRYTLERPEALKMKHTRYFEYTVVLEAYQSMARRWKFRNPVDGRIKFPLTATPREHLQMFVDNMNRRDSGWAVGECIDAAEHLISYDCAYCLEALQQMAQEFETEYEFVGKTVNLRKVEYNKSAPLSLAYGKGRGFKPDVGRSNSGDNMPVEILFVQGGDRNIDPSTYGSTALLLPSGQTIRYDGSLFEDEEGFDADGSREYIVSEDGLSLQRNDKELSSQAEDSVDATDIYPKRVGTVGQVITVDAANNFYDFTDADTPSDPCPNYEELLISGETMTVAFQAGMLAGRELEVKYIHEARTEKGVVKLARRFEIVPQEIDGQTIPNETFKPAAGDKYIVLKCSMPQSYIRSDASRSGASWELFRTAVRYMYEHEEAHFTFTGTLDGIWAKQDWANIGGKIVLGGYVQFTDERFQPTPVLVRIIGIKDYINNPHSPEITLSNETVAGGVGSTIRSLEAEEVMIQENHAKALQFTKRRFRDAQETMRLLEKALIEGYSQSISPVVAQMLQLLVGDDSLQFRFVDSPTAPSPAVVSPTFAYSPTTGIFSIDGGYYLQHLTEGVATVQVEHAVSEYKWWSVEAYQSAVLDNPDTAYYIYAKCPTTSGEACMFLLSEAAIAKNAVSGYYHYLVGVLNSEQGGERSVTTLYGFTEITGGRITTDKIVSADGKTYFDLANSIISGTLKFLSAGGTERLVSALEGDITTAQAAAEAAAKEAVATKLGYASWAAMVEAAEDGETIISGGYLRNLLIDTDNLVVKNVYSKDGKFQILADGSMKAVSGEYKEGNIEEATIRLARNPFTYISGSYVPIVDDTVYYLGVGLQATLDWTTKSSGRRITLLGGFTITAPSGKYFYENGRKFTGLTTSYECTEMIGWGTESTFFGWILVSRTLFNTTYNYGRNISPLAYGRVEGWDSGAMFRTLKVSDKNIKVSGNEVMIVARTSKGSYTIYCPREWFYIANHIYIDITAVGYGDGSTNVPLRATYINAHDSYYASAPVWAINIRTSDEAGVKDGSFLFRLYNMAQWDD